jgi:hypothetical protein
MRRTTTAGAPARARTTKYGLTVALLLALPAIPGALLAQTAIEKPAITSRSPIGGSGPKPTDLRAEPTPTSTRLRWTCVSGPTGYEVYATPKNGATTKLTATPIGPQCIQDISLTMKNDPRLPAPTASTYLSSFTHTGLAVGAEFTYVVRALYPNAFGDSDPLTVLTSPWHAPDGVALNLSGRSANLTWIAVNGAAGYQIFRKLEGQAAFQLLTPVPVAATTYNDPASLPPGGHQYYVQAVNGLPAPAVLVTIGPWPAPAGFAAASAGRSATLTWQPIAGATGYLVFRQLSGERAFQQITATPLTAATYQDNGLPPGQQHQYYVRAVDGVPSPQVAVLSGRPVGLTIAVYRGKPTVDFHWTGTEGSTPMLLVGSTAQGPFVPPPGGKLPIEYLQDWSRYHYGQVGKTEYYKLRFTYPTGTVESDPMEAKIALPPQGITNLIANSPAPGTVKVTWTCDPEATSYGYFRRKEFSTVIEQSRQIGAVCEFTETGLWNDATYLYVISAAYPERNTSTSGSVLIKVAP